MQQGLAQARPAEQGLVVEGLTVRVSGVEWAGWPARLVVAAGGDRVGVDRGSVAVVACRVRAAAGRTAGQEAGCAVCRPGGPGVGRCPAGTALARAVAGLALPVAGTVRLGGALAVVGEEATGEPETSPLLPDNRVVGYVAGGDGLLPQHTVARNVGLRVNDDDGLKAPDRSLAEGVAQKLGLRSVIGPLTREATWRWTSGWWGRLLARWQGSASGAPAVGSPLPHELTWGERVRSEVVSVAVWEPRAMVVEVPVEPKVTVRGLAEVAEVLDIPVVAIVPPTDRAGQQDGQQGAGQQGGAGALDVQVVIE